MSHVGDHFRLSDATFRPLPTQLPRPPLWVAAQAPRSLRVAVQYADAVVTLGEEGQPIEKSLPTFRARMAKLDELCAEAGRDPTSLRRCYFAGWANEPIFASVEATAELIGRYVEAGATDFTFYLYNPAEPLLEDFVAEHRAATRDQLEQVAADVFPDSGTVRVRQRTSRKFLRKPAVVCLVRKRLSRAGVWFADPLADDFCVDVNSAVPPFDSHTAAGVQVFNSANADPLPAPCADARARHMIRRRRRHAALRHGQRTGP